MYLIAGLGNPGRQYEHTRHNCGYDALDILADDLQVNVRDGRFKGLCGTGMIGGEKVLLLKPLTYMNLSGESIRMACDYYRLDPEKQLVVICDDISLMPGQIRVRGKGSAGGHNGLKSIIGNLGTDHFMRVKVGVGPKPEGMDLADYVLSHFPLGERGDMADAFDRAAHAAKALVTEDISVVMNRYNTWIKQP